MDHGPKFTLVAYKPNSNDYCMGCHVESYSSDLAIESGLSKEELIERIALLKARILGPNEEGYEMHIFAGGVPLADTELRGEITQKSEDLGKTYLENAKKNAAERTAAERARKAEEDRLAERQRLTQLLEKHPDMRGSQ